jgi:hypothetical protein
MRWPGGGSGLPLRKIHPSEHAESIINRLPGGDRRREQRRAALQDIASVPAKTLNTLKCIKTPPAVPAEGILNQAG